ncbi:unnamed protein product [Ostreobium quekettii]|uniref:glycine--tRNA ligase n=1 Tax=Ostreobium quekettii TaxID=121088 RepID=A0A8S1ILZ8_9CHLO|nr:unnamed protein product [Ostreobium quekettii]|eukprot:evm.model.scf_7.21 EVM.evm.TU.scf_7.21   scf_7:170370-176368(+)
MSAGLSRVRLCLCGPTPPIAPKPWTSLLCLGCRPGSSGSGQPIADRRHAAVQASAASETRPADRPAAIGMLGGGAIGDAPTFQEAIARLQGYWASLGCTVWLPHNTEVGAGTMNPATFLRVLGPESWNACYPEPSVRPDDSRYGKNPNRVQKHTQFQVVLKPDPGNPQELYLGSLAALGINSEAHDIRFVEDNWESPVLGAWGLGWEVWMDGMEITQFTYFQNAGGSALSVPAVEITYGLERILMTLQNARHFKDIMYNRQITYGELFLQNEYEMSCYNMEEANVEDHWTRFELYQKEAMMLLEKGLPIPAYDCMLKCSHTFNVLDARGAVGVTERSNCFAAMRGLARDIAKSWIAKREELGHPLGLAGSPAIGNGKSASAGDDARVDMVRNERKLSPEDCRSFVLEVGCEEVPPEDVASAAAQLKVKVQNMLKRVRLRHEGVEVEGTPRRLAVLVKALAAHQAVSEEKMKGPPAKVAYCEDGTPTKALEGFMRKTGASLDVIIKETDGKGVEYVFANVRDEGQHTSEVLQAELPSVLREISFKKSMRWNGDVAWSRPVRWLLALHGDCIVPVQFAGLTAGARTRVLRNSSPAEVNIESAEQYLDTLKGNGITVSISGRRQLVLSAIHEEIGSLGAFIPSAIEQDLLEEVTGLVESPTVVVGSFDDAFLRLPQDVLVTVMRKHQRYFPLMRKSDPDTLLPSFLAVANGPLDEPTVRGGNEAVLQARFEDAQFFYNEDVGQPLDAFCPKLAGTVFQKKLGSLLDKSERVESLVEPVARAACLEAAVPVAKRAAKIARADLATAMVTEMTSLAGTMGRHYALMSGESPDVSQAIFESVLPRNASDILPTSPAGILVSLCDKLDSLVGLIAAGCAPSATADPYALRRTAYGMLQTVISNRVRLNLRECVDLAAGIQPVDVAEASRAETLEFVQRRLEQLLADKGVQIEAVRSVLSERGLDPYLAATSAEELAAELRVGSDSRLSRVMTALSRPIRIMKGKNVEPLPVDVSLFLLPEEEELWQACEAINSKVDEGMPIPLFLERAEELVDPINAFFDKVFVMADDASLQQNRLALMRSVASLPDGILDFSELPGF